MIRPALATACLAALSCATPPRPVNPAAAEVEAEIRQTYADLSARDWEKFASHFAERAVISLRTREGAVRVLSIPEFIEEDRKAIANRPVFEERCETVEVRVHRDLAHAWSRFRGKIGTEKKVVTWSGIDAYTLQRSAGRWKVVAIAVSTDE